MTLADVSTFGRAESGSMGRKITFGWRSGLGSWCAQGKGVLRCVTMFLFQQWGQRSDGQGTTFRTCADILMPPTFVLTPVLSYNSSCSHFSTFMRFSNGTTSSSHTGMHGIKSFLHFRTTARITSFCRPWSSRNVVGLLPGPCSPARIDGVPRRRRSIAATDGNSSANRRPIFCASASGSDAFRYR